MPHGLAGLVSRDSLADQQSGGFGPFRQRSFAVLWAATVLGNIGTFIANIASSWLVTDLSGSPAALSLVQAAGTLPVFLLSLPAGVLSDIFDRRRFLIGIQVFLALTTCLLVALSYAGLLSVTSLVVLNFAGGVGAALMGPAWQAVVPELVPRRDLKNAIALNSLGINISRSIGPAIGGVLLADAGAASTYAVDALSFLFVIAALTWWRRAADHQDTLTEGFLGGFRAGLRYAKASRPLRAALLRSAVFFAFASAVWALLPLVARNVLGGDAGFYGVLLGAAGVGAILAGLALPALRRHVDTDGLLSAATIVMAFVTAGLAFSLPRWAGVAMLVALGAAWIVALTTFNGIAQSILPNWVRGRGLSLYLTVFNGAMTAGTLGWGMLAQAIGVRQALLVCGATFVLSALLLRRVKLPTGDADLTPSNHWPEPLTTAAVPGDRGPVLVLVRYRVTSNNRSAFLGLLYALSGERRRDGAYAWGVCEDAADPERILEWFMVESWAEHLRQHKRVSNADAELQQEAIRFHTGPEPPKVQHLLSVRPPAVTTPR
jgi:MFS family permease